jgi:hypothetical protein
VQFIAGIFTFFFLQALVYTQYYLADTISFRTVKQMNARGIAEGLPLNYHYGIAGDKIYLSLLIALIVAWLWPQWQVYDMSKVFIYALGISVALGVLWCLPTTPEAHMVNHSPTMVGLVHGVYMIPVIMILLLAFFYTPQPYILLLILVAVVFTLHLFVGQHMLLGLQKAIDPFNYRWYPDQPLTNWLGWTFLFALAIAFSWRIKVLAS